MSSLLSIGLMFLAAMIGMTPREEAEKGHWTHLSTLDLTGSQSHFKDWQPGGENATSWQFRLKGQSRLSEPRMDWDWRYDVMFGQAHLSGDGFRKTADELFLETQLTRKLGLFFDPYIATELRTQMANGYRYPASGGRVRVTRPWDPGLTQASAGVGKEFGGGVLSTRAGVAALQRWVRKDHTTALGVEVFSKVALPLSDYVKFTNEMRAFRGQGRRQWVVRNDAVLRVAVLRFMTVTMSVQFLEDPRQSEALQVRQVAGVGLGWSLE